MGLRQLSILVISLGLVMFIGCRGTGRLKTPSGFSLKAPTDAAQASTVSEGKAKDVLTLPKGSTIVTEISPATAVSPAVERTTITLAETTVKTQDSTTSTVALSPPRPPDQTVALAKIAAQERQYLLLVGIGLGIAGIALRSLLPAWPGLSNGAFIGAALALAAWKLAEIPAWVWAVSLVVMGLIALGYKRGQIDRNHDGIPDILQRTSTETQTQVEIKK